MLNEGEQKRIGKYIIEKKGDIIEVSLGYNYLEFDTIREAFEYIYDNKD